MELVFQMDTRFTWATLQLGGVNTGLDVMILANLIIISKSLQQNTKGKLTVIRLIKISTVFVY